MPKKQLQYIYEPKGLTIIAPNRHPLGAKVMGTAIQLAGLLILGGLVFWLFNWAYHWAAKYDFWVLFWILVVSTSPFVLSLLKGIYQDIIYFFNKQLVFVSERELTYYSKPWPFANKHYFLKEELVGIFYREEGISNLNYGSPFMYSVCLTHRSTKSEENQDILYRYFESAAEAEKLVTTISQLLDLPTNNRLTQKNPHLVTVYSENQIKLAVKPVTSSFIQLILNIHWLFLFGLLSFSFIWSFSGFWSGLFTLISLVLSYISVSNLFQCWYNEKSITVNEDGIFKINMGGFFFTSKDVIAKATDIEKMELAIEDDDSSFLPSFYLSIHFKPDDEEEEEDLSNKKKVEHTPLSFWDEASAVFFVRNTARILEVPFTLPEKSMEQDNSKPNPYRF